MNCDKPYDDEVWQKFNRVFWNNGDWIWPEVVPEWAGGQARKEEFYSVLREAWVTSSDPKKRMLVAQHSGIDVWKRLIKDDNMMVRAAVALAGDDNVHQELASDSSSLVRGYVADFSSPAVLQYMADHEENLDVVDRIARRKDRPSQSVIVERFWDQPDFLQRIVPLLSLTEKEHLLSHEDQHVRLQVGENGTKRQAKIVMEDTRIPDYEKLFVANRLQELEEISAALQPVPHREHDIGAEQSR